RYLMDGRIEFEGRIDNQVKVRGYRIELGEVETVLGQHPAVQECVVIAREDVAGDKRLVGYVVAAAGQSVNAAELRGWVKERLPEYMVPVAMVAMERLPLSPNGKVDRKNLPAPEYRRPELEGEYQQARTPAEEVMAGIWAEVLKLQQVGVHDDFFALGGHSLLATQVISRVRQAFQVELPLRALFEASTVAGLTERVEAVKPPQQNSAEVYVFPMSFAQRRLWFLDQLEPGSSVFNTPFALRLKGYLKPDALQNSLTEIVRRHEVLRANFREVNGNPSQVVNPPCLVNIPLTDLSHLPDEQRDARVRELANSEAQRPFNLANDRMVRASLLRLRDDEHVLLLTLHHIVFDGWSRAILVRELAALYDAFSQGKPSPLAEMPLQYTDFAVWQNEQLQGKRVEKQLSYWREQLQGAPQSLDLPTDRPRPAVSTFDGASHLAPLPKALTDALTSLGRTQGSTLFMMLLAGFQVLLARYSGQEDMVVGSPIANRNRAEIENLIGFFVNTLLIRTDLSGDPSFRELLKRVREVSLGAYAHQDLPFEKLVEELQPERSLSHNPLFQVMFSLRNVPTQMFELSGLKIEFLQTENTSAKIDLALWMSESRDGLVGRWEYNTDLFDRATVERMAAHFETLLRAVVENLDLRMSEIPLLPDSEKRKVVFEWNQTARARDWEACNLMDRFEEQVRLRPDQPAFLCGQETLTYQELNVRANRIAHYLTAIPCEGQKTVAVCMERSLEAVAALLGVFKAGCTYLPLDPSYPQERLAY